MRRIPELSLWLGHAGDGRDLQAIHAAGISAVVDLAAEETPANLTRGLTYLRLPLVDGPGNPTWSLRIAIASVAHLLECRIPTLVCCSAGMSRSPGIAGAAVSLACKCQPLEGLSRVSRNGIGDVSPALWTDIQDLLTRWYDHNA